MQEVVGRALPTTPCMILLDRLSVATVYTDYFFGMAIHFFSKSPAVMEGFGLRRMAGGVFGIGALGISIYMCVCVCMCVCVWGCVCVCVCVCAVGGGGGRSHQVVRRLPK